MKQQIYEIDFAPTNEAFAKLPTGTVDHVLKPQNVEKHKGVLTYNIVEYWRYK